ncbi:MAG: PfkB family carbohydrate kinase [Deltaproteobacteria bacterium]|nr:PfkB family carbohydrate kinase [Deltaproteobacteria bacterium]
MQTVLIIAGSDPGAGAGLQQDLKTATLLGTYGLTVATALTVQNSLGVQAVHPAAPEVVAAQLDAVLSDFPVHAIKIGMLATAAIARVVAAKLKEFLGGEPGKRNFPALPAAPHHHNSIGGASSPAIIRPLLILDPVLAAGRGEGLLDEEGIEVLKEELFPLAYILTPNVPEAERLTGLEINTPARLEEAARRLQAMGPEWVLAKGGHLAGPPVDILTDGKNAYHLGHPRLEAPHHHGSGCLLATALAAHLAEGLSVPEAVNRARQLVQQALKYGLPLGQGVGPVNPYAFFAREVARHDVSEALQAAAERLVAEDLSPLIPGVMSDLGYAAACPEGPHDVAAFPGRILKTQRGTLVPESPAFGASGPMAGVILTVMEFFPHLRAAMTIKYVQGIEELAPKLHLRAASFDPSQAEIDAKERGPARGVLSVIKQLRSWEPPPDLICDKGGWGRVPLIWILGENPVKVAEKALAIKNSLPPEGRT